MCFLHRRHESAKVQKQNWQYEPLTHHYWCPYNWNRVPAGYHNQQPCADLPNSGSSRCHPPIPTHVWWYRIFVVHQRVSLRLRRFCDARICSHLSRSRMSLPRVCAWCSSRLCQPPVCHHRQLHESFYSRNNYWATVPPHRWWFHPRCFCEPSRSDTLTFSAHPPPEVQ